MSVKFSMLRQQPLTFVFLVSLCVTDWLAPLTQVGKVSAQSQNGIICSHNPEHTVANCSGRGLDSVPWGLHKTIETLDLSNNRFFNLTLSAFKNHGYTSLKVLLLRNNSIEQLHAKALEKLDFLQTLDISNNRLHSVPAESVTILLELQNLSLAGNNLQRIPDFAFDGLKKLRILDLSGNRITDIGKNSFSGLQELQVLRLENNALINMYPETFQNMAILLEVHLYKNPWVCDCKLRWLREWMSNDTRSILQQSTSLIQCDGPSFLQGKSLDTITLDELACKVEMLTSGSTRVVDISDDVVLECKYFSNPIATPVWFKNEAEKIDFSLSTDKYFVNTTVEDFTTITRLFVKNFQYTDIMLYECVAENVRGSDSTTYRVTLTGVDFDSVVFKTTVPPDDPVDPKNIVIAVASVCGIILVVTISILIFCFVSYMKRKNQARHEAVVENVKRHFLSNGGSSFTKAPTELDTVKVNIAHDDSTSDSNRTNDTNATQVKQLIDVQYPNEVEPVYTFQQPSSPFANGNTYVSFGSEAIDPELLPMNSTRHDGSHTESTTPLIDQYTPVFDSDDPLDDSLLYPVYGTATMYYPPRRFQTLSSNGSVPLTPGSTRSATLMPARYHDYRDYREMRYPYNTQISENLLTNKKSISAGNLGFQPPRKPPRVFQSGEYVEMSPQDTIGSVSDYPNMPQSPHYGTKPGTPV